MSLLLPMSQASQKEGHDLVAQQLRTDLVLLSKLSGHDEGKQIRDVGSPLLSRRRMISSTILLSSPAARR
jgi:hypothetical protein